MEIAKAGHDTVIREQLRGFLCTPLSVFQGFPTQDCQLELKCAKDIAPEALPDYKMQT